MTETTTKRRLRRGQWVIFGILAVALLLNGVLWWMRPNDARFKASLLFAEDELVTMDELPDDVVALETALGETERLFGSLLQLLHRIETEDAELSDLRARLLQRKSEIERRIADLRD